MDRLKPPSGLDPAVFWPSVAVAGGFVAWGTLSPDSLATVAGAVLGFIIDGFGWTFVVSTHTAQETFNRDDKSGAIWGAYGYDAKNDVLRAPMKVMKSSVSVEEFTIGFVDVTATGGNIAMWWDTVMAVVPFTLGGS